MDCCICNFCNNKKRIANRMIDISNLTGWYDNDIINRFIDTSDNKHFNLVKCLLFRELGIVFSDTKEYSNIQDIVDTYPEEFNYIDIYTNIIFAKTKEYKQYNENDSLSIVGNILNQSYTAAFYTNNIPNLNKDIEKINKTLFEIYIEYILLCLK